MTDKIQWNLAFQARDEAHLINPGNINENYEKRINHIKKNESINEKEKKEAIKATTKDKDRQNFFELKQITYPCDICGQAGFTVMNCEHCVRDRLSANFTSWTSGNDIIDHAIQEAQTKCPIPSRFPEWIEYQDIENVKHLTD